MAWVIIIAVVFVVVFLLVSGVYVKGGKKPDEISSGEAGVTSDTSDASADE